MHGLGFASALGELGLKGATLVRGLVGFNLGVEIGQLMFVAVFLPALLWLSRGRGARLTPRIASLAVALVGTYWLADPCQLAGSASGMAESEASSASNFRNCTWFSHLWHLLTYGVCPPEAVFSLQST